MKMEPKEVMQEIVAGHVPLSLLNQVAGRLPAEMLQEAVDFLSKTDSDSTMESDSEPREPSLVLLLSRHLTGVQDNFFRQHPSYAGCLMVKREYYQNCSVLDCVTQCSQSAAHLCEQFLQVQQIGFVTSGPLRCA